MMQIYIKLSKLVDLSYHIVDDIARDTSGPPEIMFFTH